MERRQETPSDVTHTLAWALINLLGRRRHSQSTIKLMRVSGGVIRLSSLHYIRARTRHLGWTSGWMCLEIEGTRARVSTCQDGMRRPGPDEVVRMNDHFVSQLDWRRRQLLLSITGRMILHVAGDIGVNARIVLIHGLRRLFHDTTMAQRVANMRLLKKKHTICNRSAIVAFFHCEDKRQRSPALPTVTNRTGTVTVNRPIGLPSGLDMSCVRPWQVTSPHPSNFFFFLEGRANWNS